MSETDFSQDRDRLTSVLLKQVLLKSYWKCKNTGQEFPFIAAEAVLPGLDTGDGLEQANFSTALIVCVDGKIPPALNRHFRLRASNRVTWRNMRRFSPKLDLSGYKSAHCRLDSDSFEALLELLLPMDYALLIERPPPEDNAPNLPAPLALTHMHVKVERLTDNAIKDLGKSLGYIERRLFERGEDYVEALEAKFFEYFGFSERASGRKSAAAMAAQLLSDKKLAQNGTRFAVFVASQEDGRLTVLDESEIITQYLLVRLPTKTGRCSGLDAYCLDRLSNDDGVYLLRLRLLRTSAAQSGSKRRQPDALLAPWLEIQSEEILAHPAQDQTDLPGVPIQWATAVS